MGLTSRRPGRWRRRRRTPPARSRRRSLRDLNRRTGEEDARHAVDDHLIALGEAGVDDPVVADLVTHLHRLGRSLAVGRQVDELALRPFEHRARGHQQRIGPGRAGQAHAHELAGLEHAVRVGHLGLGLYRAGVARHPRVGEQQLALARVHAAVRELDFDRERLVRRQLQLARGHFVAPLHLIGVGDAEAHFHRVGLRQRRQQRAGAGHQRALAHLRAARRAGERRLDLGVAQVQRGLGAARLRALEVCARHLLGRRRIVVFALAHRARLPQRLQAIQACAWSAQAWPRRRPRRRRRD